MSQRGQPHVIVLAGPNGAGKSTTAPALLKGALGVAEFVNADVIARGLSAFAPERVALAAGRIVLRRLRELADRYASFAFETTMASRRFAPWLAELKKRGYRVHLVFLWLPSADFAIARVAERVRLGGHNVPEHTVRRRYDLGLQNFFLLYQPVATTWRMYDNSRASRPRLVVRGEGRLVTRISERRTWTQIKRCVQHESQKNTGHF